MHNHPREMASSLHEDPITHVCQYHHQYQHQHHLNSDCEILDMGPEPVQPGLVLLIFAFFMGSLSGGSLDSFEMGARVRVLTLSAQVH
jgi:hypothetical protein